MIYVQNFFCGEKFSNDACTQLLCLLVGMNNLLRGVSRDDINALNNFLQANGITENAAAGTNGSPLWTAEMSLTTEDGNSPVLDNIRWGIR